MQQIVFYDGECGFCNASVRFILNRDHDGVFHFSPQQSDFAKTFFLHHGGEFGEVDSLIVFDGEQFLIESSAVISIGSGLPGIWSLARIGKILPKAWRDALYRFFARRRYRWFGKRDACQMPTADEAGRFHFDAL